MEKNKYEETEYADMSDFFEKADRIIEETIKKAELIPEKGPDERTRKILDIIEGNLTDDIGITAAEYDRAGWLFMAGLGVEKNSVLAKKAYEKAVMMGYEGALVSLATIFREEGNEEEYYKWLLEAAFEGEYPSAFLELGELYFKGEYVNQDYAKAYKYFELASDNGAFGSKYYIAYYADKGILGPRDEKKAILYYIAGVKEEDFRCCKRLDELNVEYDF